MYVRMYVCTYVCMYPYVYYRHDTCEPVRRIAVLLAGNGGLGFRVWGLGFRVQGSGLRVSGFGFWV